MTRRRLPILAISKGLALHMGDTDQHVVLLGIVITVFLALVAPLYKIFFGDHVHRDEFDRVIQKLERLERHIAFMEARLGESVDKKSSY